MPPVLDRNDEKGVTVLLVGHPGSWKTTWAAGWPGPLILSIVAEGGDESIKPQIYEPIAQSVLTASKDNSCPPIWNQKAPPVWPVHSTAELVAYVKEIEAHAKEMGICTVIVDSLTYLIDLWVDELVQHKSLADKTWLANVKKMGGDFLGPPEYGLLNHFLRGIRVRLGNHGLNVIWTALQQDTYRTDPRNMAVRELESVEPMITGRNRVTLPGSCKLHIWAEKDWVPDQRAPGRDMVQPTFWTSSSRKARWVRHRYGLAFPQGKLVDPEFGTFPTFRAVWMELHPYIYTGQ